MDTYKKRTLENVALSSRYHMPEIESYDIGAPGAYTFEEISFTLSGHGSPPEITFHVLMTLPLPNDIFFFFLEITQQIYASQICTPRLITCGFTPAIRCN